MMTLDQYIPRRHVLQIMASVLVSPTLERCGSANVTKVRFGISPFQDTLIPILGQAKGWYREEGLDVRFRILGWTEVQEALSSAAANKVDVAINNETAVVATHNRNPELVYVYGLNPFDNGFALMARPDGPIHPLSWFKSRGLKRDEAIRQTAQQLRGRTVITTANTDMEQGVAAAARRGHLDFLRDLHIINLNPDDGLAAFLSGRGDLFIGGLPQRFRAKKEGNIEILTGVDLGPVPINGLVSTSEYVRGNASTVVKLLKVWFRTIDFINHNLAEGAQIIIDTLNANSAAKFTTSDFKNMWNKLESFPPSPSAAASAILAPGGRSYWRDRWEDCNSYLYNIKHAIPRPVNPNGVFLMGQIQSELLAQMHR